MKRIISICLFAVYVAVITPNEGVAQESLFPKYTEYTDENLIQAEVKENFIKWMQKGEFERMADYQQRLKDSSLIVFKQVYVSVARNMIRDMISNIGIRSELFYDTESEMFSVYFTTLDRYHTYKYKSFIHVPFSTAQKFKERWNESDKGYFVQDWCFINGELHFKTINCTVDEQTYSFPIQEIKYNSRIFVAPKDFKEISLAFNSLDIDNEYLRDVVLMYSDVEKQIPVSLGSDYVSTRTANTLIGADHRQPCTYNLSGRSVVGGFPLPAYNNQNQGKVVVEVTVNQEGKVTAASAIGKGSTTQDAILWKAAKEAAMKTRFSVKKDAPISQIGTITYVFSY
jgi:TonB family protein